VRFWAVGLSVRVGSLGLHWAPSGTAGLQARERRAESARLFGALSVHLGVTGAPASPGQEGAAVVVAVVVAIVTTAVAAGVPWLLGAAVGAAVAAAVKQPAQRGARHGRYRQRRATGGGCGTSAPRNPVRASDRGGVSRRALVGGGRCGARRLLRCSDGGSWPLLQLQAAGGRGRSGRGGCCAGVRRLLRGLPIAPARRVNEGQKGGEGRRGRAGYASGDSVATVAAYTGACTAIALFQMNGERGRLGRRMAERRRQTRPHFDPARPRACTHQLQAPQRDPSGSPSLRT
jgi:hypothetical protein